MTSRALTLLLLTIATTSCASSGAVPRPFPTPGGAARSETAPTTAAPAASGYAVAGTALTLRGAPYRDGGADPNGFDCSGLVQYVYGQHAVAMPRSVAEQARVGRAIEASALEPGDLVFFATVSPWQPWQPAGLKPLSCLWHCEQSPGFVPEFGWNVPAAVPPAGPSWKEAMLASS